MPLRGLPAQRRRTSDGFPVRILARHLCLFLYTYFSGIFYGDVSRSGSEKVLYRIARIILKKNPCRFSIRKWNRRPKLNANDCLVGQRSNSRRNLGRPFLLGSYSIRARVFSNDSIICKTVFTVKDGPSGEIEIIIETMAP